MGKFLSVGDQKFEVRGVTYGTFRSDRFAGFPEPSVVKRDFAHMAACGFNTVRVYTPPHRWLLDLALESGLRVLAGLPWEQHVAFLDDPQTLRFVETRVRQGVSRCAGHPALLCYAIGNEIPAPIVRWSGRRRVEQHLRRLYDVAKDRDPDGLVTYVNYPSTEYLDLPFLDLVAFNVFLESREEFSSYVARLQNVAGDRPLILTELGLDSQRHGLDAQARLVASQIEAARVGGCAGSFVFAWTDEWHRGGWDVTEWDFGLTTRDRRPKPALEAARRAWAQPLQPPGGRWPRISAVVCVHNGAPWIRECLGGLTRLNYPDYEVIVVDDGSTDATAAIVQEFDVRFIRTRNEGLSNARNTGIAAADGEIVAFIDADAWPDEDWLTHLALAFESTDAAGVGGPNIAPPGVSVKAACIANAPGGPVHVLRTDREAEHIPGCNMAFRKSALEAIGGFDPIFRVAGDDVDVCWRMQERGWTLGFAPAAVVWHHPRDSIGAFVRQQRGYGAAEALLEAKWPQKYNAVGHVTWGGRVYAPPTVVFPGRRSRVYQGSWGEAPFQHLENGRPSLIAEAASMPEWYLALALLGGLSLLGILWPPLLVGLPLLLLGAGATLTRAVQGARRARFPGAPLARQERRTRIATVVLLHLVQPAARLAGRFSTGLVPWRRRAGSRGFALPTERRFALWRESGESMSQTLGRLEATLQGTGAPVRRGGGYDPWDLQVEGGSFGSARIRACIEDHGGARQLLRAEVAPRLSPLAWFGAGFGAWLALWAALDQSWMVGGILAAAAFLILFRALWEAGSSAGVLTESLLDGEASLSSIPVEAASGPRDPLRGPHLGVQETTLRAG